MKYSIKKLWFLDVDDKKLYINERAVKIRAGMLLLIPLFLGLTLFDVAYTTSWVVDGNTVIDTYETNIDEMIIYSVEATRRVYEYTLQTSILFYALFEMIAGMFLFTSRFSPTILISSFLARNDSPVWKPLAPKRLAWSIGTILVSTCLVYFNPVPVAETVNFLAGSEVLSTTENFLPRITALVLVFTCIVFMWLEAILGLCAGCKLHEFLVWIKVIKDDCVECNNICDVKK